MASLTTTQAIQLASASEAAHFLSIGRLFREFIAGRVPLFVQEGEVTATATELNQYALTIATSGSAAGDQDSATPTAANVVTAGQAINFVVAGGGSGGSPRIHLVVTITR